MIVRIAYNFYVYMLTNKSNDVLYTMTRRLNLSRVPLPASERGEGDTKRSGVRVRGGAWLRSLRKLRPLIRLRHLLPR